MVKRVLRLRRDGTPRRYSQERGTGTMFVNNTGGGWVGWREHKHVVEKLQRLRIGPRLKLELLPLLNEIHRELANGRHQSAAALLQRARTIVSEAE